MRYKSLLVVLLAFTVLPACKIEKITPKNDLLLHAQRGRNPGIYDATGRFMLMRGVNYNVLGDYWAANPAVPPTAPYDADQFRIMASYGFNCVRLIVNWSALEPERGNYDLEYVGQIRQAIEDAAEHGIYILLDMHQDAYGKYIASPPEENCESPNKGWDGAPEWATFTDGQSTCSNGGRETARAVVHAFQNFWDNKEGIQDAFIQAWAELVKHTAAYPTVMGYDLINEPGLGYGALPDQIDKLAKFYRNTIEAIRMAEAASGGYEHIVFFETTVTYNGGLPPSVPPANFTQDKNIVFAPHNYFEVIGPPILTIEQGAALYDELAGKYQTHCFIGEWGVFGDPLADLPKLLRFARMEDEYLMGSTWWQWSQAPGDPHSISWDGTSYPQLSMHLVEVDVQGNYTGRRNEVFLDVLSRARPVATQGQILEYTNDPEEGLMTLKAWTPTRGFTLIWSPDRNGPPLINGHDIAITEQKEVEGGYWIELEVVDDYEITVEY